MDLHTKELQSMNSAVAAQLWTPSKCFQPPPPIVISKEKISEALLNYHCLSWFSCRCNLSIAVLLNCRTVVIQQNKRNHCIVEQHPTWKIWRNNNHENLNNVTPVTVITGHIIVVAKHLGASLLACKSLYDIIQIKRAHTWSFDWQHG